MQRDLLLLEGVPGEDVLDGALAGVFMPAVGGDQVVVRRHTFEELGAIRQLRPVMPDFQHREVLRPPGEQAEDVANAGKGGGVVRVAGPEAGEGREVGLGDGVDDAGFVDVDPVEGFRPEVVDYGLGGAFEGEGAAGEGDLGGYACEGGGEGDGPGVGPAGADYVGGLSWG